MQHRPFAQQRQPSVIPTPVLGVLVLIASELLFFTGLFSAHMVIKATSTFWAPPPNVFLPVANTAFNTGILILSGALFAWSFRRYGVNRDWARAKSPALIATALGAFFVVFQGLEWSRLLSVGLTMQSGAFGALFYLIIGSHAVHVVAALLAMLWTLRQASSKRLSLDGYQAMMVFWTFVVAIWPILYRLVYFS